MKCFIKQFIVVSAVIIVHEAYPQDYEKYQLNYTTKIERITFRKEMINEKILSNLSKELSDETEKYYMTAFWAAELMLYKDETIYNSIKKSFRIISSRSVQFQRSLLECVHTLYTDYFNTEINEFIKTVSNAKIFAMCAVILGKNINERVNVLELMKRNFKNYKSDPILNSLEYYYGTEKKTFTLEEINEIINNKKWLGKDVIFTFQKENRDNVGRLIIKKRDGSFITNERGKIFSVPQLARSVTNLPSFLTNGNTPVGIYSVLGFDYSKNVFIGPTQNIQMVMPFEVQPAEYFHNKTYEVNWTEELYESLLPESMRKNRLIKESYYAGKAGRTEIIAHGTTIDTSYYFGEKYFLNTPSLGCLCAYESWDDKTGIRNISYQQDIIDQLNSIGFKNGFLVVLQIDGEDKSISEDELTQLIEKLHCLTNEY